MFVKDLELSFLLDFYGGLLPERRRNVMNLYFNEDYSLSEIGNELGISRQAVQGIVKRGESELKNYEIQLGLAEKFIKLRELAEKINAAANGCDIPEELKARILELTKEAEK